MYHLLYGILNFAASTGSCGGYATAAASRLCRRRWPEVVFYLRSDYAMAAKPKTIDDCLAAVSADKRAALEKLRKTIKAAAPKGEEVH